MKQNKLAIELLSLEQLFTSLKVAAMSLTCKSAGLVLLFSENIPVTGLQVNKILAKCLNERVAGNGSAVDSEFAADGVTLDAAIIYGAQLTRSWRDLQAGW